MEAHKRSGRNDEARSLRVQAHVHVHVHVRAVPSRTRIKIHDRRGCLALVGPALAKLKEAGWRADSLAERQRVNCPGAVAQPPKVMTARRKDISNVKRVNPVVAARKRSSPDARHFYICYIKSRCKVMVNKAFVATVKLYLEICTFDLL